jgi:hypothetical protein
MSSAAQINANRENAQLSTGPVTDEGKRNSSLNATRHGFTGLSLVVTEPEREAYEAHVQAYHSHYLPEGHIQTQLIQQLAELDWSLHQISLQQLNVISLMNSAQAQSAGNSDPLATAQVLAGLTRTLNTLNLYEQRRRRAAKAVREEFEAAKKAAAELQAEQLPLAAEIYKVHKAKGESWDPLQFGFVCSSEDIELFLKAQQWRIEADQPQNTRLSDVAPGPQL